MQPPKMVVLRRVELNMQYQNLVILLSCHSLEDFPVFHEGEQASSLLASWTALWHPLLINNAQKTPTWCRVDEPPEECSGHLLLAPLPSESELQTGFAHRVADSGGLLIKGKLDRDEIVRIALENVETPSVDDESIADFYALGYCFLQVQLLTRHMRYSSNLDEVYFNSLVVDAATAAAGGNRESASEKIRKCFDILAEERNHFYPVDAFLIDLTLCAESTLNDSLKSQLESGCVFNLMMNQKILGKAESDHPEILAAIKDAVTDKRLEIIGGEVDEFPLPLMSMESLLRSVQDEGKFKQATGAPVATYGRRRYGLTPWLPQVLASSGYSGALHVTLDDGRFPEGMQTKTKWDGYGAVSIPAVGKIPLDVAKPESFLSLGIKIGESMDMDHVATMFFVRWPGKSSPWFDDLIRSSRYGSALGNFVRISEFFEKTEDPYHADRFEADQYRAPYLKQMVGNKETNPNSRVTDYWQREIALLAANGLKFIASAVSGKPVEESSKIADFSRENDQSIDASSEQPDAQKPIDQMLEEGCSAAAKAITKPGDGEGILVLNPYSFVRRVGVDISGLSKFPKIEQPVYAADESGQSRMAVVDVPPMGFAWVNGSDSSAKVNSKDPDLVGELVLRNEFMEVLLDKKSGGIYAIHDYKSRNNRLSQKVAFRYLNDNRKWQYSDMIADSIETVASSKAIGIVKVTGKLVDGKEKTNATFEVTYTLLRGSRTLAVDLELNQETQPVPNVWESYYCTRSAWHDEGADLVRTQHMVRTSTREKRFEAPLYVEIEAPKTRTCLLGGGNVYHHRRGLRMMDSILASHGETKTHFRYGVGIDLRHPLHSAIDLMAPTTVVQGNLSAPKPQHSWLFHLDTRNVIVTFWEPIFEGESLKGFRARLLETMGRNVESKLSAFRPIQSVRQVEFSGAEAGDLIAKDGKAELNISAMQFMQIEAYF